MSVERDKVSDVEDGVEVGQKSLPAKKSKAPIDRQKKLIKSFLYLFTKDGIKVRNIPQTKPDEVAVEDYLACEHFKKDYTEADFEAFATSDSDKRLKEESHFLLLIDGGKKIVKYFPDGVKFQENSKPENKTVEIGVSEDAKDGEKDDEVEELKDDQVEEEEGKKNESQSAKKQKKKNKQAKKSLNKAEKEDLCDKELPRNAKPDEQAVGSKSSGPVKTADKKVKGSENISTKQKNPLEGNSGRNSESKNDPTASGDGRKNSQNVNEDDSDEFTETTNKKKNKKKGKQSGAVKTVSEQEVKQEEHGSPVDAGKKGKKDEPSSMSAKSSNNAESNPGNKQTNPTSNPGHKQTDQASKRSAEAEASDVDVSPSAAEPESKKAKKKVEDAGKKIPKLLTFLFTKGGLEEKGISVGNDGFVDVQEILDVYKDQYNYTLSDVSTALENSNEFFLKPNDDDGLLVKASEQKSHSGPSKEEQWEETGKKKAHFERQTAGSREEYRQKHAQDTQVINKIAYSAFMPMEKFSNTVYWLLGRDGAAKNNLQFQSDSFLIIDDIIKHVYQLRQATPNDFKVMAEKDPKEAFLVQEVNGRLAIKLNDRRQKRDRNSDFQEKSDFHLSKTMSFLLRHKAKDMGLQIESDGFMFVDNLLQYKDLRKYKEEDVRRVVMENDKQRFFIDEDFETGRLKVRANQGHTMEVKDLDLEPITSATDVPMVMHGTYHKNWRAIQTQGLNRMTRNHIHFAQGEPGADGVISGMRSSCEILIYVDLEKALKDGIKFFRSANNVILSPGNEKGELLPKYFSTVVQRQPRVKLL